MSMYAVVSAESLVVKYTKAGDIEGLQHLFSAGIASPFTFWLDERRIIDVDGREIGIRSTGGNLLQV